MLKTLAIAGSLGVFAALAVTPTSAVAATSGYALQVKERPATLHHDGSATVVFWLRCAPGMNAFEYNVGLAQDGASFGAGAGDVANLLPCDGVRHKVKVTLGEGLRRGPADIDVNVSIFDPVGGGDIFAEDSAHVWLR